MTRLSDGLVCAQEHLETRRYQPTYADHGLDFRMKRDAHMGDQGVPKARSIPTPRLRQHTLSIRFPERMRTTQAEGYGDIPVKNTFVHFVEGGPFCDIVERWSSCPANLESNKIETTSVATVLPSDEPRGNRSDDDEKDQRRRSLQECQLRWAVDKAKTQPQLRTDITVVEGEVPATRAHELRLSKTINRKARAVLDVTWSRLTSMNGVNLATALHRIARHSTEDPSQISDVHLHPGFGPMMKAIERLSALDSVRDEGMFGILAELAGPRLRELKPYEEVLQVTNLIWAFAKLTVPCVPLYQSLAGNRNAAKVLQTRRHGEYKAQCLSAAVWSFAQSAALSRTAQIQLFKSIGDEMAPQVASLKPQEMANTVWSFGRVRVKHQRLFEEICGTFANNPGASRFSIPQLTSILMGCAQVRFQQPEVIGRISAVMLRNSHALTPEQTSCVLWSLAELDAHDMAAADLTSFKHEELHNVMTAARTLCPQHRVLFDAYQAIFGEDRSRDGSHLLGILEESAEE
ncbi:unnamed protein product [Symbiodinium sp. KB8]|nr:unnamed protein product [Symbiodinium sp. KB8]